MDALELESSLQSAEYVLNDVDILKREDGDNLKMDLSVFTEPQRTKDFEYLIGLINILNLEDCDKNFNLRLFSDSYRFIYDFITVKNHVWEQKKICYSYGLDSSLFDDLVLKKMHILVSYFSSRGKEKALEAYCSLRSQLFLEENSFFYEIMQKVEEKLRGCHSEPVEVRLMDIMLGIEKIYDIYL